MKKHKTLTVFKTEITFDVLETAEEMIHILDESRKVSDLEYNSHEEKHESGPGGVAENFADTAEQEAHRASDTGRKSGRVLLSETATSMIMMTTPITGINKPVMF